MSKFLSIVKAVSIEMNYILKGGYTGMLEMRKVSIRRLRKIVKKV